MREHNALKYLQCHDLCIKYAINERLFDLVIILEAGIKKIIHKWQ